MARQAWRPIRLSLEPSKAARNLAELLAAAGIPPSTRPPALRSTGPQPPSPGQHRRLFCRGCRSRQISIPAGPPVVIFLKALGRAKGPNSPWRTSCWPVSLPTAPGWPRCPRPSRLSACWTTSCRSFLSSSCCWPLCGRRRWGSADLSATYSSTLLINTGCRFAEKDQSIPILRIKS
jgi:hypothetical protein